MVNGAEPLADYSSLKNQYDYICEYSAVRLKSEREAYLAHLDRLRSGKAKKWLRSPETFSEVAGLSPSC